MFPEASVWGTKDKREPHQLKETNFKFKINKIFYHSLPIRLNNIMGSLMSLDISHSPYLIFISIFQLNTLHVSAIDNRHFVIQETEMDV